MVLAALVWSHEAEFGPQVGNVFLYLMRISHLHTVSACELAIFIGSHYLQYLRLFDLFMCVVGRSFRAFVPLSLPAGPPSVRRLQKSCNFFRQLICTRPWFDRLCRALVPGFNCRSFRTFSDLSWKRLPPVILMFWRLAVVLSNVMLIVVSVIKGRMQNDCNFTSLISSKHRHTSK